MLCSKLNEKANFRSILFGSVRLFKHHYIVSKWKNAVFIGVAET